MKQIIDLSIFQGYNRKKQDGVNAVYKPIPLTLAVLLVAFSSGFGLFAPVRADQVGLGPSLDERITALEELVAAQDAQEERLVALESALAAVSDQQADLITRIDALGDGYGSEVLESMRDSIQTNADEIYKLWRFADTTEERSLENAKNSESNAHFLAAHVWPEGFDGHQEGGDAN